MGAGFAALAAMVFLLMALFAQGSAAAAAENPAGAEAAERLEALEDRIRENPEDIQAVFEKALLLARMDRVEEAKDLYESLISDYPNIPEPYNNLAALYAAEGRLVEARNLLETVTNTHPGLAIAHENLGDVYAALAAAEYGKLGELGEAPETAMRKLKALREVVEGISFAGGTGQKEITVPVEAVEPEKKTVVAEPGPLVIVPFDQTPPEEDIRMTLENWARAWTEMEPDRFLSFYDEDYTGASGETPEVWREKTSENMKSGGKVEAKVEDVDVEMLGARKARASFVLRLSPEGGDETAEPRGLTLAKIKGRWVIVRDEKDTAGGKP